MAGYPVVGVSASCTHDPQGVDIYDEEGNLTHYDLGDTVPLSKLISRRYSWLVNRGYLSEVETDDWGSTVWGEISGTLSSQTDLQNALDAKLNLTGGTLTGLLTITSGANTFGFKNGGSSVTPQFHLGTSGGKSVGLLAGTSGTAFIYDSTGSFNIATDTKANIDAGTSTGGTARLTLDSSGNTTLSGDLTISKASGSLRLNSTSGDAQFFVDRTGAGYGTMVIRTGASSRWTIGTLGGTETGSDANTNFLIGRHSDSGSYLGAALTITRSTGAITLAGPLTVGSGGSSITGNSTNSGNFTITNTTTIARVSASSGMSTLSIEGPAGQWRELVFKTGTSARWSWDVSTAAESGSNAGSNLALYRYNDAGGSIGTPILVDRATGLTTLSSLTVSGATTLSSFTSSSTATLSGSTTISGSFNIGAYNAVPTLGAELGDGVSMTQTVATTIGTYYYVTATTLSACTISPAGSAGETSLTIQANRTAFIATAASHTLTGTGTGFLSVKAITAASTAAGTFVGQAIRSSAQANLGVGADALARNFTNYTTAIGHQALQKNVTGYGNIALGYYALGENLTGSYNTSVGYAALGATKTGGYNTAFGANAMVSNVNGVYNTASGYYAGYYATGSYNVYYGVQAGSSSTGNYNTFVGTSAGRSFTTGSYNLALGASAGYSGTTGTVSGSVVIGTNSSGTAAQVTTSDTIVLGTSSHNTLVAGTSAFTGQMSLVNGTLTTLKFAKAVQYGYSSSYRAIILGDTATTPNNVTVSIGYDPSTNASGSFTGDGREVLFRNAAEFMTPNSGNTSFIKPLKWDSAGKTTLINATLTDTTDSSSTTTGALTVAGGIGIAKALYVGTDANVAGIIEASDIRAISQVMGAF